jgi:hypothetical protein
MYKLVYNVCEVQLEVFTSIAAQILPEVSFRFYTAHIIEMIVSCVAQ